LLVRVAVVIIRPPVALPYFNVRRCSTQSYFDGATRVFDNVQTFSFGTDMLIGLAPLIALGLEPLLPRGP